jgi:8-amino-7-oxononanoate synthase
MGTLSKAVGAYGGYLCTDRDTAEFIRHRARSLIYSTGLPPGTLAAIDAALDLIEHDAELVERPLMLARRFTDAFDLPPAQSAIVPVILGDPARALVAAQALEDAGCLVVAMRPPTVPEGTSRLRITFSAGHSDEDVARLIQTMKSSNVLSSAMAATP